MKIVLLEDVKTLGKKGDIVEVNEGYARNFLLPKKKGVEATPANLNTLKLQKANEEKKAVCLWEFVARVERIFADGARENVLVLCSYKTPHLFPALHAGSPKRHAVLR